MNRIKIMGALFAVAALACMPAVVRAECEEDGKVYGTCSVSGDECLFDSDCPEGETCVGDFIIYGGHVSGAGATLFVDFFRSPASTNDWIDVNGDGFAGFDEFTPPFVDQLGDLFVPGSPLNDWWMFQYRSIGSVNGFNEFVDNQLLGTIPTSVPSEAGLLNRFEWATKGSITWAGPYANPSGTPYEPCEIEFAFLDVPSAWAVQVPGDPAWFRMPLEAGYGLNPIDSHTGYPSQLQTLAREGAAVELNQDTTDPDENTIFDLVAAWVPVSIISNRGVGMENIKYTEAQYLFTTGRLPNGENVVGASRDVGSGTRNAAMNSLGIDTSWGRGENFGEKHKTNFNLGPNHQASNNGGSSVMEGVIQNRRLAIGYTGLAGSSRSACDAKKGKYEILGVCKDVDGDGDDVVDCDCSSYVRPTINTVLDNCDPCTGYQIAGSGSFVVRGDVDANRHGWCSEDAMGDPVAPPYQSCITDGDCPVDVVCVWDADSQDKYDESTGQPLDNQQVAEYINNIFDSIEAFEGDVEDEDQFNMPGQFLATTFFLPAGEDCLHEIDFPTKYFAIDTNLVLQEYERDNNDLGCDIDAANDGAEYAYGVNNAAGLCPTREALGTGEAYSDGSQFGDYYYWDGTGYATVASGEELSKRNQVAGDFNETFTRDITDAAELVKAYYTPRAWQQTALAIGDGTDPFDLGDMTADNAIPEIIGDFDGNGSLTKEDLRYFADGLGIKDGKLNRLDGAKAIDQAIFDLGKAYPWADTREQLLIPPTPPADPTFETPEPISSLLVTGKSYEMGDFRCDVAGRVADPGECKKTSVCTDLVTPCQSDDDCPGEETCTDDAAVCLMDDDCLDGDRCIRESFPTPGAHPTGWDGKVDDQDIDYVCENIGFDWAKLDEAIYTDMSCDMDGDLEVTYDDVVELVEGCLGTALGDFDLDGDVDADDETILLDSIKGAACNEDGTCGWADGDCNCDGYANYADLGCVGLSFEFTGVESCVTHGETGEFCLPINEEMAEMRLGGIKKLVATTSLPMLRESGVFIDCGDGPVQYPATTVDNKVIVTIDPALPTGTCCTLTIDGVDSSWTVIGLEGDITQDGIVNSLDASAIKPRFGQSVTGDNYIYDIGGDGLINSVDASGVKPRFGDKLPDCP